MADKESQHREDSPRYPGFLVDPEELLSFIESTAFRNAWKACDLTDENLF
jgi:hypothetical protein